ncbi:hypothetical protein [Streptomyces sp. NPDC055058]
MTESTTPTPADIPRSRSPRRRRIGPSVLMLRTALLEDPHGHLWVLLTHVEDVSEEEPCNRLAAAG